MAPKRCAPPKRASAAAMARKRCAPTKRASAAAMAPKHSAARSPSPPLVISSESSSEEEEEVALVISSAAAAAAAMDHNRWPPPKPSDDEESEASEEEAPKRSRPPKPADDEESEASSEEEEEEEEVGDEMPPNQEMVGAKGAKRPRAPYRPLPNHWESEISDEEEEEEEEVNHEMPLAKPAPNQEMAAQGAKLRGAPFQRSAPPSEDQGRRLFDDLGKNVCPSSSKAAATEVAAAAAANRGAGKELDETCEQYPCLAKEVKAVEKGRPGLFMWEFLMMDDGKARALEEEIKEERKKWRHLKMRLQMKVANTLMDLAP